MESMSEEQVARFIREMERRFRSRTPTTDPNYILADWRVGRSEMVTWANETLGLKMGIVETADPALMRAIKSMWRRLRREFPEEKWGA